MPAPDVLVVGAGIVGAACAEALTAAGLSVEVLESRFAGGGATAAAMGHVVVMDDSEAQFALTSLSRRLWVEIAPEIPRDCEDEETGTLWIAEDEEERTHVRRKAAFYRQRGVEVEELSGEDVARAEPSLRPGLAGALRVPGDRVLYPVNAARWLLERASRGSGAPRGRRGRRDLRAARRDATGKPRGRRGRERLRRGGAASDGGPSDRSAQRASRDHRPLPGILPPPARRARVPEERAHAVARVGGVQSAAARDRPDAPRVLARVRGPRSVHQPAHSREDAAKSPRVLPGARESLRSAHMGRLPSGDPRQSPAHRPVAAPAGPVRRRRATRASASRRRRRPGVSSPMRSSAAASPVDPAPYAPMRSFPSADDAHA